MAQKPYLQIITPGQRWFSFDLLSMWQRRTLLFTLVARDLQVRYKNTALGVLWVVIQPLLATTIFTLIFARIFTSANQEQNYLVYTLVGFIFWQFFHGSVTAASSCVYEQIGVIRKIYFPRLFLPLTVVLRNLTEVGITTLILIVIMWWQGVPFSWMMLLGYPLTMGLLVVFTSSVGFVFSCLHACYRDFRHLIPFVMQIWFYATPVFYHIELLGEHLSWLTWLNPVTQYLQLARLVIFGGELTLGSWLPGLLIAVSSLFIATAIFKRLESKVVDTA